MKKLTPKNIADDLGVSVKSVRAMIHAGQLIAINVGTGKIPVYRIDPVEYAAYQERRQTQASQTVIEHKQNRETRPGVIRFCRAHVERERRKSLART